MEPSNYSPRSNKRPRSDCFPVKSIPLVNKSNASISCTASLQIRTLGTLLISKSTGLPTDSINLQPFKAYTFGRNRDSCEFRFEDRQVSKQHFQFYFDALNRKVFIADGIYFVNSTEGSRARVSLNGVYIDGVRIGEGEVRELHAGNKFSLVCGNGGYCGVKVGFVVESIVFIEEVPCRNSFSFRGNCFGFNHVIDRLGCSEIDSANLLLNSCRGIVYSDKPVLHIRECTKLHHEVRAKYLSRNRVRNVSCHLTSRALNFNDADVLVSDQNKALNSAGTRQLSPHMSREESPVFSKVNTVWECCNSNNKKSESLTNAEELLSNGIAHEKPRDTCMSEEDVPQNKKPGVSVPPPGNKFYLNRLHLLGQSSSEDGSSVSLPELLYPVGTIVRFFVATFTSDLLWFLSYCNIPSHLPITIACHNAERCWSSSPDNRTSTPYVGYPNLVVVYPPFPDVISFGKDRKKFGIACHHPKLFVLQRKDSIRIIITSANLTEKQLTKLIKIQYQILLLNLLDLWHL